jgi:hypothetical protein
MVILEVVTVSLQAAAAAAQVLLVAMQDQRH